MQIGNHTSVLIIIERLVAHRCKWKGEAKEAVKELKDIHIPYEDAVAVYYDKTVPRQQKRTIEAFKNTPYLHPDSQAAWLSLVFNRGGGVTGSSRREMKMIQELLKKGRKEKVAEQFRKMKRLWPTHKGLRSRQDEEVELFEQGLVKPYIDDYSLYRNFSVKP